MRKLSIVFALIISICVEAQTLKPYILGATSKSNLTELKGTLQKSLISEGFKIVGEYQPASDANRWLMVVSNSKLDKAVKTVGGLTGFAATLRVAITTENGVNNISYTNPAYWGNAYFREDFGKVEAYYKSIDAAFKSAFSKVGAVANTPFGSEKGEDAEDLQEYHYMFGMPYFDETVLLGKFESSAAAVTHIDKALSNGKPNIKLVYKHKVPGTNLTLYGIALSGPDGESDFMPIIDISNPKHTAFLPYEMLVKDGEVHMLHGRFRIALSFPDLTMGTFTKIMSTPGNIEELLKQLTE